jgi:hypothetical protein
VISGILTRYVFVRRRHFSENHAKLPWKWRQLIFTNSVSFFSFLLNNSLPWARVSSFTKFLDHTQRSTTIGRTSVDERPARRRDLYLTTHITPNREISMSPAGFEPTILAGERPQTYALDRADTAILVPIYHTKILHMPQCPNYLS